MLMSSLAVATTAGEVADDCTTDIISYRVFPVRAGVDACCLQRNCEQSAWERAFTSYSHELQDLNAPGHASPTQTLPRARICSVQDSSFENIHRDKDSNSTITSNDRQRIPTRRARLPDR
jgi:hypothetical protein